MEKKDWIYKKIKIMINNKLYKQLMKIKIIKFKILEIKIMTINKWLMKIKKNKMTLIICFVIFVITVSDTNICVLMDLEHIAYPLNMCLMLRH